ncbi:hypothetical protein FQN57_001657 [Myotisia sp. PD_48]|nr:hypothetical protein FQN57_001657 [Myotisia sp. PD_48]
MPFREKMKRAFSGRRPRSLSPRPRTHPIAPSNLQKSSRLAAQLEEVEKKPLPSQLYTRDRKLSIPVAPRPPKVTNYPLPADAHLEYATTLARTMTTKTRTYNENPSTTLKKQFSFLRRSKTSKNKPKNWPIIELYKPHELPRPKYRGPVDEKHKQALAAYCIVNATATYQRRSFMSDVSPFATVTPPSRNGSVVDILASTTTTSSTSLPNQELQNPAQFSSETRHHKSDSGHDSDSSSSLAQYATDNHSLTTLLTSHTEEEVLSKTADNFRSEGINSNVTVDDLRSALHGIQA